MAIGKYSKWARMDVKQPLWLTKAGVKVIVWDKWGRKRKGTLIVSVGGIRWFPYKGKRAVRVSWDRIASDFG